MGGLSSVSIFHLEAESYSPFLLLPSTARRCVLGLNSANPLVTLRTLILKLLQGHERTVAGQCHPNQLFQLQNRCYPSSFHSPELLAPFPLSNMFPQTHSSSLLIVARVRVLLFLYGDCSSKEITVGKEST